MTLNNITLDSDNDDGGDSGKGGAVAQIINRIDNTTAAMVINRIENAIIILYFHNSDKEFEYEKQLLKVYIIKII